MFSRHVVSFCLIISTFTLSECALVDSLNKCSIHDDECLKGDFQLFIDTITNEGAPELGLKKIEPLNLHDLSVTVLGVLNVTLLNGQIEGLKTCKIENYSNDVKKTPVTSFMHVICDKLVIQGNYELDMVGSLVKSSGLGDSLHGNGNVKITINKIELRLEYPISVEKHDDGHHLKIESTDTKFSFNVLENAHFEADNLIIGDKDASEDIMKYMNNNWKLIFQTFGNNFFDKAMDFVYFHTNELLSKIPTEYFINEDLSSLIKQ